MIENILELVLGNALETAILLVAGLLLGVLFSWLYWRGQVSKREGRIKDLETSVEGKDADLKDSEKRLKEREKEIESLNTQLGQRVESIRGLTLQIGEKDESIDLLKKEAADLEKKSRDSVARAEGAEARVGELEKSLEEMEREAASLKARMRAMQDDFTCIVGIGPKVSSVLRSAGISTFAKLASADVSGIREILEAENPNLLRLTDPSTWPEQARMASEGDWEALSALQDSLKGRRRA